MPLTHHCTGHTPGKRACTAQFTALDDLFAHQRDADHDGYASVLERHAGSGTYRTRCARCARELVSPAPFPLVPVCTVCRQVQEAWDDHA